jgi:hypothetical protein
MLRRTMLSGALVLFATLAQAAGAGIARSAKAVTDAGQPATPRK